MIPLRELFVRKPLVMEHPLFGTIFFTPSRGWEGKDFSFWGFQSVQLLIDAGRDGPTRTQELAFATFRDQQSELLPQFLAKVATRRAETEEPPGKPFVSTLSIPSLGGEGPARTGDLWTVWFDYDDEDHWMYGVQSSDGWQTFDGFAED